MDDNLQASDPFNRYFYDFRGSPSPEKLRGKRVRIPKGTLIHSMHPQDPPEDFPIGRTTTVTVFASSPGHLIDPYWARHHPRDHRSYHHAELTWPGSGGYWKHVRLRDVELLDEVPGIPKVTLAEIAEFDSKLAAIASPPSVP